MSEEKNKNAERNNLISSSEWETAGNNVIALFYEARALHIQEGKKLLKVVADALEESQTISNFGNIALRMVLIFWKKKCDEIELLKISKEDLKWGSKTARRKVLTKYRLTDHIFDNHLDERENLLFFLEQQRMELEFLIREIANEFKIEIPIKKQMKLFSEEKYEI